MTSQPPHRPINPISPMQIVFIAPFGLRQKTTVWARILPLARRLISHGHRVTVLIPPWDSPADAGQSWIENEVRVVNVRLDGGLPLIVGRMWRQMWRLQPDIVHIVKPRAHAGLVQWLLWQHRHLGVIKQGGRQPKLLLDIDDWEQAWAAINHYAKPVARFLAWQEEWGLRHADGITAASRWLTARAAEYAPQTPRLYLPNGVTEPASVDEAEATNSPTGDASFTGPQTVLYYTRFVEIEPAWLANFWRTLQSHRGAVTLEVAGNALVAGREQAFKQAIEHATQPGNQVNWRGFVDQSEQARLYAAAACAIFPAQAVPLQQAKCSVRLATTLLHGVPVVASAVGQQAEYGANGAAHLVPAAATPHAFAAAVAQVLGQPLQRAELSARARQHLLATFNWDDLGDQLADFYAQMMRDCG